MRGVGIVDVKLRMKVCTIVGNRPQFMKEVVVAQELKVQGIEEVLIHTGQHYDADMSDVFFKDLPLPIPKFHFSLHHKTQNTVTGEILIKLDEVLSKEKPDFVIVYGDTNSTLAGALAAVKLHIPIVHVEAGCRLANWSPVTEVPSEEINRTLVSHMTTLHCCCTQNEIENLKKEGIVQNVYLTGDTMLDAFQQFSLFASQKSTVLMDHHLSPEHYVLMTFHRAENIDSEEGCQNLIRLIKSIGMPIVFPIHPRTEKSFRKHHLLDDLKETGVLLLPPLSYLDTLVLVGNCRFVVTDSGGLQREAFFANKYSYFFYFDDCWPQIAECGWQTRCNLSDATFDFSKTWSSVISENPFGDGRAARRIVSLLSQAFQST